MNNVFGHEQDPCVTVGGEGKEALGSPSAQKGEPVTHFPVRLPRRTFLRVAAATAGALALGGIPALQAAGGGGGGGKGTVTRYPLRIPPTASPLSSLTAAPGSADLGGGKFSAVLAYNGSFPGPTFRANRGDAVSVPFTNNLSSATTIHWHGMIVPPSADGQPQDLVAPSATTGAYQFTINQRACLNWYHPHPHLETGRQVALGLAGAFIINDAEEAALGLPSGKYEVPLIVRDANFDRAGNLTYNPTSSGFLAKNPLVNGTRDPYLDVDRAVYRFRVLNGATARIFKFALSNSASFTLIGNDGGLLATAVSIPQIEIAPGERLDLLIDFRGLTNGAKVMLQDLNSGWNLLEFRDSGVVGSGSIPTGTLSSITLLSNPVTTRTFSFDGMTRINGLEFDHDRIDFEVPFGVTELWRFTTGGNAPHPVHIHGASFQVQSRIGGRGTLFPWERGWKDTVLLQDGETVDILIRFDGFKGRYLIHCHKIEHEDQGMMSNFKVV